MRIVSVSPTGKTPSCLGPARVGHGARWVGLTRRRGRRALDLDHGAERRGGAGWSRGQDLWVFQRGNYDAGTVTPSSSAALLYPSSAGCCVREANPPAAPRLRLLDRVREAIRKDRVTMLPAAIIAILRTHLTAVQAQHQADLR